MREIGIIRDRQFRKFFYYLMGVLLAASFCILLFWGMYGRLWKEIYSGYQCSIASSLLEQGVARDTVVCALAAEGSTSEGEHLLEMMGRGKNSFPLLLPGIADVQGRMAVYIAGFAFLLWIALLGGTGFFFSIREKLYLQAAEVIDQFGEGNFSGQLPCLQEGGVHRLLGSVDRLAKALSARNEAEGKAKQFLKDTISDISHQLKTPLAALTMYQEIISEEPENEETVRRFTGKSSHALSRMEQLILTLLKVTRLDAGAVQFEKQNYPVINVIKRGIGDLEERAKCEGKELLLSGDRNAEIYCDLQWTAEALGNLVKNALDYTKEGEKTEITWEKLPGMIRISISDNGVGIAEEDFYHMFKRFYRSGKGEGIGLGLPLAKAVMEGQGGMLSAYNRPEGGAVFAMNFLP